MQRLTEEFGKKLNENSQSFVTSSIVVGVCNKISRAKIARMLQVKTHKVYNMFTREDGKMAEVLALSRRMNKKLKESRALPEERKLTRDWFRSKCKPVSNKYQMECTFGREEIRNEYIIDGFPSICLSLLQLEKFQKKMNEYDPSISNPVTSRGLSQSLYFVDQWVKAGLQTPRPHGIWARCKRTFWKIIKERKRGKQRLTISFSKKLHYCAVCESYYKTVNEYRDLIELLNHAKTEHDKKGIQGRIDQVIKKIAGLRDHVNKFLYQRPDLKIINDKLDRVPKLRALKVFLENMG